MPRDVGVPTLVLQGEFDPNIRPDDTRHVVERMGRNVRQIGFIGVGHSVRHHSPCAQNLVASFIGSPDQSLNAACATERAKIAFRVPGHP